VHLLPRPTLCAPTSERAFDVKAAGWARFCRLHGFRDQEWKAGVTELLDEADLVIVDVGRISDGVMWELAQSYQCLPPSRVGLLLDVGRVTTPGAVTAHAKEFYEHLDATPGVLRDVDFRWFMFVGGLWMHLDPTAADLHSRMLNITTGTLPVPLDAAAEADVRLRLTPVCARA